jgi:type I restriction enzyme S subunit
MIKDGKSTVTPRLRFPEFRKTDWREVRLGDVADIKTGPFGSTLHQSDYVEAGTPIVTVEHLSDHGLVHNNLPLVSDIDKQRLKGYVLHEGDIVFSRVGSVDRNSLVSKTETGWLFSGRLLRIRTNAKAVNPNFLSFYFQLEMSKRTIRSVAVGQTMPSLNTEILNDILVATTDLAEQQKIADCLTSLDEVIVAQRWKVEALKAHKRGLMQQLFPREGETRPRLRFPEFCNAPEWPVHPFDYFVTRSFYGTSSSTLDKGRYPVLRMGNMLDGGLNFSNLVYLDLDPESFECIRLLPGDILLNRTNSPALVGKISLFDSDIECITASYIVTYRLDRELINSAFCNLMLNTPNYQAKINALARPSVSQANINPTTFRKELIVSVPELAEQQRIANCLSSLDAQIAAESNQLNTLKTHKQGLMQQLFPAPETARA